MGRSARFVFLDVLESFRVSEDVLPVENMMILILPSSIEVLPIDSCAGAMKPSSLAHLCSSPYKPQADMRESEACSKSRRLCDGADLRHNDHQTSRVGETSARSRRLLQLASATCVPQYLNLPEGCCTFAENMLQHGRYPFCLLRRYGSRPMFSATRTALPRSIGAVGFAGLEQT